MSVQNEMWDWEIIKSKAVLFFPKDYGSLINFLSNRKKESKDICIKIFLSSKHDLNPDHILKFQAQK